jgi:urate oxidase
MKQTTYITAKQHPVNPPELFASILANHFVKTYSHIHKATVKVIQHRWARLSVDGKPHPHSFYRDSDEKRNAEAIASRTTGTSTTLSIRSAVSGLLVLKSTGSAFHGFVQDEYTILKPTNDRILSTEVDAAWAWKDISGVEAVEAAAKEGRFDKAWQSARDITLKTFATDDSASVQATMYKMSEQILAAQPEVEAVDYSLPNKHYFEIGMWGCSFFFLIFFIFFS